MGSSLVSNYQESILGKLKDITQPLSDHFGIKTFAYRKFLNDGRSFGVSTNHGWNKWHNDYLLEKKEIPAYEREVKETSVSENNQHLWLRTGEPDKTDELFLNLYDFDIWNTMCIYKNHTNYVEGFYFATHKENVNFPNFFLNHIDTLKHYIFYFKNNFLTKIDSQIIDTISVPTISKESFIQETNKRIDMQTSSFIEASRINNYVFHRGNERISLSRRELECLQYLSHGKSTKEIASHLQLSPRTIEMYLQRIKEKTEIPSRSKLIDFYYKMGLPDFR